MRAALLARVSDKSQAESDRLSLPAQLRVMRERCEREGWEVVCTYEAPGESAFTSDISKRVVFKQVVDDAEAGAYDVLIVHELSRFARDQELGQRIINLLERRGVRLVNATSAIDYHTPEGRMMFDIDLSLGSYWSRKMSSHIRKGVAERFALGLPTGSIPFGYARGETTRDVAVIVPREATAVRDAFRDYVAGMGFSEIARRFNDMGLKPRSRRGNRTFTLTAIQAIIANDFYAGYIRHREERKLGAHRPIIDEALYLDAQARPTRRPPRAIEPRMLSGLAACVQCDGSMWLVHPKKGRLVYRETSRHHGCDCPDRWISWPVDVPETQMTAMVHSVTADREFLAYVEREARKEPSVDTNPRRDALMAEKKRATTAYVAGALSEDDWKRVVARIDGELARLPVPSPEAILFTRDRVRSIGEAWDALTPSEQHDVCREMFSSVRFDMRQKQVYVDPWPEFRSWFDMRRRSLGTPGWTRTAIATSARPWLFGHDEIVKDAG